MIKEKCGRSLGERLDAELDEFIESVKNTGDNDKNKWTEENWEDEMEKYPIFMTKMPEEDDEIPPSLEALRQLKWDEEDNDLEDQITKYREEGNFYFKHKFRKKAYISYSEGIDLFEKNKNELASDIGSSLYSNRAATNFLSENYGSSLKDCIRSRKLNKENPKPLLKGAECLLKMKKFVLCSQWLYELNRFNLNDFQSKKRLDIMEQCKKEELKLIEKEQKLKKDLMKNINNLSILYKSLVARNIKQAEIHCENKLNLSEREKYGIFVKTYENRINKDVTIKVHQEMLLSYPIYVVFPQFNLIETILEAIETIPIKEQLNEIFIDQQLWNSRSTDHLYNIDSINVYYELPPELEDENCLYKLEKSTIEKPLYEFLQKPFVYLCGLSISFIVVSSNSEFEKHLLSNFRNITNV
ncbi:hypothetical protein SNEBB_000120 [Seison nebaliae]|nr:hypothetical protein SNEBB_000120 [Seison nebaliae]